MLGDIDGFIQAFYVEASYRPDTVFEAGNIYCPGCGGERRLRIQLVSPVRTHDKGFHGASSGATADIAEELAPAVFLGECLQDHTRFTFVLFQGPDDYELAVFPSKRGGLATPNTPDGVSYYLDQAQRCQSTAANSAAVSMYRAALEHLLHEQGYTVRMLGPKIEALKKAIVDGSAPAWAIGLDEHFLNVISRLGNAAIHPGDGDVTRQQALDRALLAAIEVTFAEILHVAYERENEEQDRLAALEAALAAFDPPPAAPAES
jgi:Domain of unknown function (DUF4145)